MTLAQVLGNIFHHCFYVCTREATPTSVLRHPPLVSLNRKKRIYFVFCLLRSLFIHCLSCALFMSSLLVHYFTFRLFVLSYILPSTVHSLHTLPVRFCTLSFILYCFFSPFFSSLPLVCSFKQCLFPPLLYTAFNHPLFVCNPCSLFVLSLVHSLLLYSSLLCITSPCLLL